MKGSATHIIIVLLCALLFAAVHEAEVQGSAGAVRARLSARVGKVKNFFKPTADKLLPLRKGATSAMFAALIYASGMLPTTAGAQYSPIQYQQRDNEMVILRQNDDERLLMPVQSWLPLEETLTVKALIVSPTLVRNLAQTLTELVDEDDGDELVVSRMLRYWDAHLGSRGVNLRTAVEAVQLAHKEGQLVTRYDRLRRLSD